MKNFKNLFAVIAFTISVNATLMADKPSGSIDDLFSLFSSPEYQKKMKSAEEELKTSNNQFQSIANKLKDRTIEFQQISTENSPQKYSIFGGFSVERNFSFENTYITRNSARVVQNAISNRMLYKISANEPIWVSINYSNSKQNETVGLGYKADTIGAVIGYDFINDSEMSFGAVAAFEVTDIDYSGKYSDKNANGKQYSGFAGLYGSYTDGCFDIYASSLLGYTNYKLNRLLENETSKLAHSNYSGLSFCNKVSTDYMFETESFRFGPEASLYIDVVNQKKSTEKTATYTVNHNSNTDVYVSGEFGVKVVGKSKSAEKILVPHAFVGFYADLYKDNSKRKCHDNSGNVVKETFNNKKHHYFVVKSGFDINVNDYISASIDYVGYISNNVITNEIAAAVSYKF